MVELALLLCGSATAAIVARALAIVLRQGRTPRTDWSGPDRIGAQRG